MTEHLPAFRSAAAEAEWQRQEGAWRAQREGAAVGQPSGRVDPAYAAIVRADPAYAAIVRAAASLPAPALPAGFAAALERRVRAAPHAGIEWALWLLVPVLLLAASLVALRLNPALPPTLRALAAAPDQLWLIWLAAALALACWRPRGLARTTMPRDKGDRA